MRRKPVEGIYLKFIERKNPVQFGKKPPLNTTKCPKRIVLSNQKMPTSARECGASVEIFQQFCEIRKGKEISGLYACYLRLTVSCVIVCRTHQSARTPACMCVPDKH